MTTYSIPRTGFPELTFDGELLTQQTEMDEVALESGRFHQIAVYRTDDDEIIVAIRFHSDFSGEISDDTVEVVKCLDEVEEALSLYQPDIRFCGESDSRLRDQFAAECRELTRRYDQQVDAVLRELKISTPAGPSTNV